VRVSVVIPAYNEAGTVAALLDRVVAAPYPAEVSEVELVVVDDCSRDGTAAAVEAYAIPAGAPRPTTLELARHSVNRGKAAALRTGFGRATGDVVIVQDADLEYDPEEYPNLVRPILDGKADVVYGSRFLGGPHRVLLFWHSVGNHVLTTLSNMMTDLNLTDMETCYKVFRADLLKRLTLRESRFGFEPEFTAKVSRARCRIYEVPISYSGRDYSEGKKIGWKDGVAAIYFIFKYGFFD
jgi:glycosyltransferase involved in cell wall biosynthesis